MKRSLNSKFCVKMLFCAFVFSMSLYSCTSSRTLETDSNKNDKKDVNPVKNDSTKFELTQSRTWNYFELECNVQFSSAFLQNEGECKISVCQKDSVSMSIQGPFGIQVGKFFSNKINFQYFDVLQYTLFEGFSNSITLAGIGTIPINFNEFISFLRYELPYNKEEYKLVSMNLNDSTAVVKRVNSSTIDFAKVSLSNSSILDYQRKDSLSNVIFNIKYSDMSVQEGVLFPRLVQLTIPKEKTRMVFDIKKITTKTAPSQISFAIPKNIKRIKL